MLRSIKAIANNRTDKYDLDHFLQYELYVHQAVLFNESGVMREATKSQLADAIAQIGPSLGYTNTEPTFTVFDSGSILHQIQWKKELSFDSLCKRYVDIVKQNVGPKLSSLMDMQTVLQPKTVLIKEELEVFLVKKISDFSENKLLMTTKENFLSNKTNKTNFILLLKQHLEARRGKNKVSN